jgi:hypothetical protein
MVSETLAEIPCFSPLCNNLMLGEIAYQEMKIDREIWPMCEA